MADKIKLPNVGDFLMLEVTSAFKAPVGKFPGIEFTGTTPNGNIVTLEVPVSSVERQLNRLKLTLSDCLGRVVSFSRTPNPNDATKPYWDLSVSAATLRSIAATPPATTPARTSPPGALPGAPSIARPGALPVETPPWADAPAPSDADAPPDVATAQTSKQSGTQADGRTRTEKLFTAYEECFAHAAGIAVEYKITDQQAVVAMAATLFIAVTR